MLTTIIRREPSVPAQQRPVGPSTDLDGAILRFLGCGRAVPLGEITKGVGATTHKVHARVQTLVGKGLVIRTRNPLGPQRGPGASTYQLAGQ